MFHEDLRGLDFSRFLRLARIIATSAVMNSPRLLRR
jgi:hypothetical protein